MTCQPVAGDLRRRLTRLCYDAWRRSGGRAYAAYPMRPSRPGDVVDGGCQAGGGCGSKLNLPSCLLHAIRSDRRYGEGVVMSPATGVNLNRPTTDMSVGRGQSRLTVWTDGLQRTDGTDCDGSNGGDLPYPGGHPRPRASGGNLAGAYGTNANDGHPPEPDQSMVDPVRHDATVTATI